MSEVCGTRPAENTGRKKVAKNRHLITIAQLCRAISSQRKHVSTIGKNFLSSNISSTCPHNMVNFGRLTAEIRWRVCGTHANFNGFRVLPSLLQRRRLPEANQTLRDVRPMAVSWPGTLFIHFRDIWPPDGILPRAKFTFCPSTHHRTSFSGYISSQLRHLSTIGKKAY